MNLERSRTWMGQVIGGASTLWRDARRDAAQVLRDSEELYVSAARKHRDMRRVVRAAPRISRITSAVIPIAAAYRLHRVKTAHLEDAEANQRLEALHAASAERLYHLFVEMRGGVLKIGQFLSCRVDLLPPIWIHWLSKLQDQVPAVPSAEIKDAIEAALGQPPEVLFRSFDEEPLAAASLAQVHAAVLQDGTPVVVKVQVPGVAEVVDADLRAVRILAHALRDLLPPGDTETILGELEASVRRELSYTAEAQNLRDFSEHFGDHPDIVVPGVYEALSGETVLTMERVQGGRLTDYLDAAMPADRDRVFEILVSCVSAQVLEHGLLHADPHPGNFLVCEGPRLAVLDFGSVQRYTPEERAAYAGLALAILNGDSEALAQRFSEMGFYTENGDLAPLQELAEMMLSTLATDQTLDQLDIDPFAQMERAVAIARANPVVQVPGNFVQLGRVFGALGGYLLRYQPRLNLMSLVAPYFSKAMMP